MTTNNIQKIPPSDDLISQLREAGYNNDGRTYRRLIKQIDWTLASAEQIDKGLGVALSFADTKRGKELTEIGLERFPDYEAFVRVWPLFDPPPARAVKTRWRSSPEAIAASAKWLEEHADDYELGHWLAVKNGQLVADAPTLQEFDQIIESLGPEILATDSIIHKVIS